MALYVVYLSHRQALLAAAENFTVLIKNSITYPKFKVNRSVFLIRYRLLTRTVCKHIVLLCVIISIICLLSSPRRNILPHINSSYLKTCEFNRTTDPHCPIFRLKHMVSEAGEEFQEMAAKVSWESTLNFSFQVFTMIKVSYLFTLTHS